MGALRLAWILVASATMALLGLAGSAWLWAASEGSLALVLRHADLWLPAGHTLSVSGATGSLQQGGHIRQLHWRSGEWEVRATDLTLRWTLAPLLDGELRLDALRMAGLQVTDRRQPATSQAPASLEVPLRVSVPLEIGVLDWQAGSRLSLKSVTVNYVFDSKIHRLDKGSATISSLKTAWSGTLQARAPMAVALDLSGELPVSLPRGGRTVTVQGRASLRGTLAGEAAALDLQARWSPSAVGSRPRPEVRGQIAARWRPWQAQSLDQVQADWQGLDLAQFWPAAPRTLLEGSLQVNPDGAGWQARTQLRNRSPGPWDRQGLPLEGLTAHGSYQGGNWRLETVSAQAGGGQIQGGGQLQTSGRPGATGPAPWQVQLQAQGLQPRLLDTRLPAGRLDGTGQFRQDGSALTFGLQLSAAAQPGRPGDAVLAALAQRITGLRLQGHWTAPQLRLDDLELRTPQARLAGRLAVDLNTRAADGDLQLDGPGIHAQLAGQLSQTQGQGRALLRLNDLRQAGDWLQLWPGMGELAAAWPDGQAQAEAGWQGGWQDQGRHLRMDLQARASRLSDRTPTGGQPVWQARDLQARLNGTLADFEFGLQGQVVAGAAELDLDTRGRAGRQSPGGPSPGGLPAWQATLQQASLALRAPEAGQGGALAQTRRSPWRLDLLAPVTLQAQPLDGGLTLALDAGRARLSGPVEGTPLLSWQRADWTRSTAGGVGQTRWRSQGSAQGLPLSWLEVLGQTRIAQFGLRGDLVFAGAWDAAGSGPQGTETLSLRASLARGSGDLHLLADELSAADLRAGVREARLDLALDDGQLQARLLWDSERAGQARAELGSRLQRGAEGWTWPAAAPLTGRVRVELPPVNAWSMLAPPGWRLRGTLDADARIGGTRAAPLWSGNLRAQDLAVRAVAEGIDFSGGTLRARLDGQTLLIDDFTLQGASGTGPAGVLRLDGSLRWLDAPAEGATAALNRWRIDLNATADRLRVSARADRRLVMSGRLSAQLGPSRLSLRGALRADQALFTLPEDSAPALGEDVRVRRASPAPAGGATGRTRTAAATTPLPVEVRVALDLGDDFQVRGRGLTTRVAGQVELRNAGERSLQPVLQGEVRAVKGSYRAYGQSLDIESGVLRFSGAYDNPALDVLALRPNLSQKVGVQITGSMVSPVFRLYADPELPDAEKLSWLVLGRSAANGGAEAALLQRAALTLLGGNAAQLPGQLAQALRLDEFSVRGGSTQADGSSSGATVTLGKRLSSEFYVAYERSLAGTLGTLYIFFDLTRRLTLRAQAGQQSAVDLIFTLRYD